MHFVNDYGSNFEIGARSLDTTTKLIGRGVSQRKSEVTGHLIKIEGIASEESLDSLFWVLMTNSRSGK